MRTTITRAVVAVAALLATPRLAAQDAWVSLTTGTTQDLNAVHFISEDEGFVAGAGGLVLKTTDGGATWEDVSLPVSVDLYGVHFFDGDVGVAVGSQGTIVRTTDGGATWAPVQSGTPDAIYDVSFSGDVGIASAGSLTILRSEDQGQSWATVQPGSFGPPFYGAHLLAGTHGFVCGQNAIFQPIVGWSDDAGATWDFATFYLDSNEGYLRDIRFVDPLTGVAVGAAFTGQGAIARTTDGGQTWTTTLFTDALESVVFATDAMGYAVGFSGGLLKTTDAGQTWTSVPSGSFATLNDVALPTPSTGYVAGSGGTVLKGTLGTGTSVTDGAAPLSFALEQNHPNPVRAQTVIRYHLTEGTHVRLRVYDALGKEVAVPVDGYRAPGAHALTFDASRLGAGVYLYVLEAGASTATRSMHVVD